MIDLTKLELVCPFHALNRSRLVFERRLSPWQVEYRCPTCRETQVWQQLGQCKRAERAR